MGRRSDGLQSTAWQGWGTSANPNHTASPPPHRCRKTGHLWDGVVLDLCSQGQRPQMWKQKAWAHNAATPLSSSCDLCDQTRHLVLVHFLIC